MKKNTLGFVSVLFISGLITAATVLAQDAPKVKSSYHPCKNIMSACEKAGYVKGGHRKHEKKGLWVDCFKPVLANQSVQGVSVNPDDLKACQERKAKKQERREEKKENPVKK